MRIKGNWHVPIVDLIILAILIALLLTHKEQW